MMTQKQPFKLPAFYREADQPQLPQDLVPASGQQTRQNERERSLVNAMVLLVSLAALWPLQEERNALLAAVKEAVVEEQRVDVDDAPCKCQPTAN